MARAAAIHVRRSFSFNRGSNANVPSIARAAARRRNCWQEFYGSCAVCQTVFIVLGGTTNHMPDIIFYLVVFALGFAGGYSVREYMSRKRHRRARQQAGY